MTHAKKYTPLLMLILLLALLFGFALTAKAQDFYGEGNVLIAVDMAPYAENEGVDYPEDTMGTLVWGSDATGGDNTRPAFNNRHYEVSPEVAPIAAPEYKPNPSYSVNQTVFLPFIRDDDPDFVPWLHLFSADDLPKEVFTSDGKPLFLIGEDCVQAEDGETYYWMFCEETEDGEILPCVDFLEIECVAVTDHATVWQHTGKAYSTRTDFDPNDYADAVDLTETEKQYFLDTCEKAYQIEGQVYGDPRFEDMYGDKDGKAAFVAFKTSILFNNAAAYYTTANSYYFGFDCLIMDARCLPNREIGKSFKNAEEEFESTLIHELNHYIVAGCTGWHTGAESSIWLIESLAQRAVGSVMPEDLDAYGEYNYVVTDVNSRLRMMPGLLWGDTEDYPSWRKTPYSVGWLFLQYVERRTTGSEDGRLWTEFLTNQTPDKGETQSALDKYITDITGESLNNWMAQFMAALIIGADDGPFCIGDAYVTETFHLDRNVFFRDAGEYGQYLGVIDENSAADASVIRELSVSGSNAIQGGGTAYAYRNDAGGRIAINGADDRWYFFAAYIDLPDPDRVVEISTAEELAKIGKDPAYPLSGHYILTADIDLKGGPENQWMPIGSMREPFIGALDGSGYTVQNLYIDGRRDVQGLFGMIAGNAVIRDLTVTGSVTGDNGLGGITGMAKGGTVKNCVSRVAVTGTESCGGVVGWTEFGTVTACEGFGTVMGSEFGVGGVVGYASGGTVSGCKGLGTVTGQDACGGVVGSSRVGTVSDCTGLGTVTGRLYRTGGVIGNTENSTVSGCTGLGAVTGQYYCGGVVGYSISSAISDCTGNGTVTGQDSCGSVVGYSDCSAIYGCTGQGTVTGRDSIGGIVGGSDNSAIGECWNEGAVTGELDIGGIVGTMYGDDALIRDCYNTGAVTGSQRVGGITGDGWDGVPAIENNYSYQSDLPLVGEEYEGTITASYVRSDTNTGEGYLTTVAFSNPASFTGWDFENVWTLEYGVRPMLRNNPETIVIDYDDPVTPAPPAKEEINVADKFDDISEDDWYYEAVSWAVNEGLMNGVSEDIFDPDGTGTRAMVVTMLWRLAGEPEAGESDFRDIAADSWYELAVNWAAETGAVLGTSEETFSPNEPITREQLAVILYRYAQAQGLGFTGDWAFRLDYSDADQISDYAYEAMCWMTMHGVINGMGDGTVAPQSEATRAQIATIFMRFSEEINK